MITAFPTWILMRIIVNFTSPEHPWYKKRITLLDWYNHQTDLTRIFDVIFWMYTFATLMFISWLLKD